MIAGPSVDQADVRKILIDVYDIGSFVSFKRSPKGLANAVYFLETTTGIFILKICVRHNSDALDFEIDLLEYIEDLPIPRVVETRDGRTTFLYKGHRMFMYKALEGEECRTFSPTMLRQVGEFLANFHLQTSGFLSNIKRTEWYNISRESLECMIRVSTERITNQKILNELSYFAEHMCLYQLPPTRKGVVHMDLKPENALFKNQTLTGVVDFDHSYVGPLVLDLAYTMMWFCGGKGVFDMRNARTICSGYSAQRKLDSDEREHLFEAVHYAFLSHVIVDIYYLALGKLPEEYIFWGIENQLRTEQKLSITKEEFLQEFHD